MMEMTYQQAMQDIVECLFDYLPQHTGNNPDSIDWKEISSALQLRSGTRLFMESAGSGKSGIWKRRIEDLDIITLGKEKWEETLKLPNFVHQLQDAVTEFFTQKYGTEASIAITLNPGDAVDCIRFDLNTSGQPLTLEMEVLKDVTPLLPREVVQLEDSQHNHYYTAYSSDLSAILGRKIGFVMLFDIEEPELHDYRTALRECAKAVYDVGISVLAHGSVENALQDEAFTEKMTFSTLLSMLRWHHSSPDIYLLDENNWLRKLHQNPEQSALTAQDLLSFHHDNNPMLQPLADAYGISLEQAAEKILHAFSDYTRQIFENIEQYRDYFEVKSPEELQAKLLDPEHSAIGPHLREKLLTPDGQPKDSFSKVIQHVMDTPNTAEAMEHITTHFLTPPAKEAASLRDLASPCQDVAL